MAIHTILVAIGLFALTFLSPGPNLLVVVHASLAQGRAAGIAAGLGVAAGDALYAALGLFGMATLIASSGTLFAAVKVLGGAYLVWYGSRMALRRRAPLRMAPARREAPHSAGTYFRRGLLTDLANPQTVLFFASIFSVTLTAQTDAWTKLGIWLGMFLTSVIWRLGVSQAFSLAAVRRIYQRVESGLERVVGVALGGFGLRLMLQGLRAR